MPHTFKTEGVDAQECLKALEKAASRLHGLVAAMSLHLETGQPLNMQALRDMTRETQIEVSAVINKYAIDWKCDE